MTFLDATLYGVIQGLTEFLPVSSSGHLALLPKVLGISDPGVSFDLAMHLGTSLAVLFYYRKIMAELLSELLVHIKSKKISEERSARSLNLCVAMAVTFLGAVIFKNFAKEYGRSHQLIAFNLIVFGLVMWASDRFGQKQVDLKGKESVFFLVRWRLAFFVGFSQALAIFPGVSRSGITLTAQRLMGVSRQEAMQFSFLLSAPIIISGFVLNLPAFLKDLHSEELALAFYGVFVSGLVGLVTIHYFLKFVGRFGLGFFAFYRILLGLAILYSAWR